MAAKFVTRVYRLFRTIGLFGHSKKRNLFGLHPALISIWLVLVHLAVAALLRRLLHRFLSPGLIRQLLLEFVATIELCATCFELIVVADNWGVWWYAVSLFLLTVWWGIAWATESACSYTPIEETLEGGRDLEEAALLVFAQLLGALATFTYVQVLWAMELTETHKGRAFEECTADLQVTMWIGAAIEAVGTCACRLIDRILREGQALYAPTVSAFFSTMLVVAAFNYSGGYFNPALATSLKLGCQGNSFLEHVVVYWMGAIFGAVLSVYLYKTPNVQNYVKSIRPKIE